MNREIENKFFAEYDVDGAALLAIDMVLNEHCKVGSGTASRPDYPDGVFKEIAERTDDFNAWGNSSLLIDEIKSNLIYCNSPENIRLYVKDILFAFSHWALRYNTWREGLNAIGNTAYHNSLEQYYIRWRNAYISFAQDLAVELAERGISIFDIQKQYGISIIDNLDVDKCWYLFGSRKRAEECLAKICRVKTTELPAELDKQEIRKIFDKAIELGLMDSNYNWKKSIELAAFFVKGISDRFNLGKGLNANGTKRINWKIFKPIFGYTAEQFKSGINQYTRTNVYPIDYELVEECFE